MMYIYQKHTGFLLVLLLLSIVTPSNAQSVPTVVILTADGNYLFHVSGFLSAEKLESILLKVRQFTSRQ